MKYLGAHNKGEKHVGCITTYAPNQGGWGKGGGDGRKFGNLTGTYHRVLVAFYEVRNFEIPESRFLGLHVSLGMYVIFPRTD